jgi:hypothetical protein
LLVVVDPATAVPARMMMAPSHTNLQEALETSRPHVRNLRRARQSTWIRPLRFQCRNPYPITFRFGLSGLTQPLLRSLACGASADRDPHIIVYWQARRVTRSFGGTFLAGTIAYLFPSSNKSHSHPVISTYPLIPEDILLPGEAPQIRLPHAPIQRVQFDHGRIPAVRIRGWTRELRKAEGWLATG